MICARPVVSVVAVALVCGAANVAAGEEREGGRGEAKELSHCDGGVQQSVFANAENKRATTTSNRFVPLPNATVPGGGGGGSVDTYIVTLSGQASKTGGDGQIRVQALLSIDGGPFATSLAPAGETVFHSGSDKQVHTMTWCYRVNAGTTDFRIRWRSTGGGTAVLDNYVVKVERYD